MNDTENSGFVRQRRNLIVISLVILFSEISKLSIPKINVFGNELTLQEPQSLNAALWIAGFYWLWRFYQYSPSKLSPLTIYIFQRVSAIAMPSAQKVLLRKHPELRKPFPDLPDVTPIFTSVEVQRWGQTKNCLDVEIETTKAAKKDEKSCKVVLEKCRVQVTGIEYHWLRVRALIYLIIHTPLFTEYVLPYVLFSLPLGFALLKAVGRASSS